MKQYEVELSQKGIQELISRVQSLKKAYSGNELIKFISEKCYDVLLQVTRERLIPDEDGNRTHTYRNNHQMKVDNNTITLWNETVVDLDSLNLSPETRANYPSKLSLAKIVEFGTGIVGANSQGAKYAENWEYDVNNHGYKGWVYVDENGQPRFTRGMEGKLIFYETKKRIEQNISSWLKEYMNKNT